ncbi:MAG: histidine kinase [Gammaproteobacteria bacterium]|nr:histidine kinase [Gammaproteobacteria bacterium]
MEADQTTKEQIVKRALLPDFCQALFLLPLYVLTEGFAITITLVSASSFDLFWNTLAITSFYMLWIAVLFSAFLCLLRPLLSRLTPAHAYIAIYLILLATISVITEFALWLSSENILPQLTLYTDMLLTKSLIIGAIVGGFGLRYLYIQQQWRIQVEAEASYRLQALQARIRPHFFFNTLNSITSLIHSNPDQAESAMLNLADLFRQSLNSDEQQRTLQAEIDLTKGYLEIESLRLGQRLNVDWQIDLATLDLAIPPLILQPLVENAIYHGIEQIPEGGAITIQTKYGDKQFTINVSNPIPQGNTYHALRSSGHHMALENIGHRIEMLDSEHGTIEIMRSDGQFIVTLTIPTREAGNR